MDASILFIIAAVAFQLSLFMQRLSFRRIDLVF